MTAALQLLLASDSDDDAGNRAWIRAQALLPPTSIVGIGEQMNTQNITQARLKELLHYDPLTGIFTWKIRPSNAVFAGDRAGCLTKKGYRTIRIAGHTFYEHRLAWLYMTGVWPSKLIDHRDGVKSGNHWDNLRDVSGAENNHNIGGSPSHNTHGNIGATYDLRRGCWVARIQALEERKFLGSFATAKLASAAYLKAKDQIHPTHLRLRGAV